MEYVNVGKIVNTRGLKGQVKVISSTSFEEERFAKGSILYINFNNSYIRVEVLKYSKDPKFTYLTFKELEDINLVEKYKSCDLVYPVSELKELKEDNYYYKDLYSCKVYMNDEYIGQVSDIEENNKMTMLRIKCDNRKNDLLVLFMKQFIKEVDIENKKIYLNEVEGLL